MYKLRIGVGVAFIIVSILVADNLFVSKTEQMLWIGYCISVSLVIWKWHLHKFQYLFALLLIVVAVLLLVSGYTMIRYIHYIDKTAVWAFYFFVTGIFCTLIDTYFVSKGDKE